LEVSGLDLEMSGLDPGLDLEMSGLDPGPDATLRRSGRVPAAL
jgi:oligoribonuclease (3'-5' exoribonuclease)